MQGILSTKRRIGPLADENELEYISALHQTCIPSLRMDGTISSADIASLLNSKYGIIISPEVAKDIAVNLCGAKSLPQNSQKRASVLERIKDFKASIPLKKKETFDQDNSNEEILKKAESPEDTLKEDKDEDVHFNLVQVLALLLIPNILEHAKNDKMAIFEHSFDSLLEPLQDDVEEDFRKTGQMDLDMLRNILLSSGDYDSSQNEELMENMLKLYQKNDSCIYKSFIHCLTSDVMQGYDADTSDTANEKSSTFFDVFGCNWDDAKDTWENFKKVATFTFVDYPNQSFYSISYNTALWAFYIFSVLYYWIGLGQSEVTGKASELNCSGNACSVAKKIISWSLTGATVGSFGLCFLIVNGFGNVAAKRQKTLLSVMTVLLTLIPFSYLMDYWKHTPHNSTTNTTYFNICPPDWVYTDEESGRGPIPIAFETSCYPYRTLCKIHLELQGKKLVNDPFKLTFEEDKRCGISGLTYRLYSFGHLCANGICGNETGNSSCDTDKNCSISNYQGACGYAYDIDETYTDLTQEQICCPSGHYTITSNGPICTKQPAWSPCTSDLVCESGICTDGFCQHTSNYLGLYSDCNAHEQCLSGFCNPLTDSCTTEWWICPSYLNDLQTGNEEEEYFLYEIFSSLKIPPVCTSQENFCKNNAFFNSFDCDCDCVIEQLVEFEVITMKNETNSTTKYKTTISENLNKVERSLEGSIWSMLLLCSGIISFFIICVQLIIIFLSSNQRTREYETKCAASVKTNKLIGNAVETHQCHGSEKDLEGATMRNYFKELDKEESTGGLFWVISNLISRDLHVKEGIHISPRIYIANFAQIILLVVFIVGGALLVHEAAEDLDKYISENSPLTDEDVEKMDYEEFYNLSFRRIISRYFPNPIIDKFPKGWMIKRAAIPGLILPTLVGLFSIVVYMPSYVSTTLKMRSGVIATFRDPQFLLIRQSSDQVNLNLGNIIYSLVGACLLSAAVATLATLVFVWPFTRDFAVSLVFTGIGILVSTVIKMILQKICRSKFFNALHRKNVQGANISNLFFECWYIATATLTIVARIGVIFSKLLFGISRTDIAFIHPDVGSEKTAASFRCEILVNEAHSHPYLDRLCGIYLRRLRDGDRFGNIACQAWRSLFIIGLCPWMIKKQVNVSLDAEKVLKDGIRDSQELNEATVSVLKDTNV